MHLNFTCEQGEMWIYTKYENFGPFCGEKRRKRGILTEIYNADFEGSLIRNHHFRFYQFFKKPLIINLKRTRLIWYSKTTGCGFLLGLNSSWIFFRVFREPTQCAPSAQFARRIYILRKKLVLYIVLHIQSKKICLFKLYKVIKNIKF